MYETRTAKIEIKGNGSTGGLTSRIQIPQKWGHYFDITLENRDFIIKFDDNRIITKKQTTSSLLDNERNIRMILNKHKNQFGYEFTTYKLTLPYPWVRDLGFTTEKRQALLTLDDDRIIIQKYTEE